MEEMLDEADDIPMDAVHKKNIHIFRAQAKPKFQAFKTNITGRKMPGCCGSSSIVLLSMVRGVIETRVLYTLRKRGLS